MPLFGGKWERGLNLAQAHSYDELAKLLQRKLIELERLRRFMMLHGSGGGGESQKGLEPHCPTKVYAPI